MENNNTLEYHYSKTKKDKNCDIYKHLQIILESKNLYWNYKAASLCLTEKRIPSTERSRLVIRHAEVLFENNSLEYIIKILNKIYNKPNYQEYIKSKKSIKYYEEELNHQKDKARISEQKRQEENSRIHPDIIRKITEIINSNKTAEEKSEYILTLQEPEYNYYAIINLEISIIQKQKHYKKILESNNTYWNYKCIKAILRTKQLTQEEKTILINKHIEIILNSNDKEVIAELLKFLKYKNAYKKKVNSRSKKR